MKNLRKLTEDYRGYRLSLEEEEVKGLDGSIVIFVEVSLTRLSDNYLVTSSSSPESSRFCTWEEEIEFMKEDVDDIVEGFQDPEDWD